ncbi:pre-mRNA splicing factor 18, putative [Babesia bigemina]|uniref:Pre-mRNA-splicing factor 18 n=1 Tax=Babesia bigemina TaxID=5866 RepID=A0A061DA66_BABBI|nr:pre-mRNA splicing factor 18, putative [Babesia bigemina]CDR94635.1 pre-mRNA splicing factor 18, putative [Babesia bigemina]|eukprot:XP_012766821.1 pre-mRNA splicing factor 18, putative [Babesia bigemina]
MRALFDAIHQKKQKVEALKKENQQWIRKADEIVSEKKRAEEDLHQGLQRKKGCIEKQIENLSACYFATLNKEAKNSGHAAVEEAKEVPDAEIIKHLRSHMQPALLFGETKEQRFKRLYEVRLKNNITKHNQNVFVETIIGRSRIGGWISKMLKQWQQEVIAKREEDLQQGNIAEAKRRDAMLAQTKKDLQPLVRLLKTQTLEEDTLHKIYKVVECCEKGEYKEAHDAYMILAIGNAAWPMGVTMVGIHERAGRSKICTSEVAHILNDETTRKYIQMIKRLLSFDQKTAPVDPSKLVQISTSHI